MPAAVAVPLISTAVGAGASIYSSNQQKKAAEASARNPNPTGGGTAVPRGTVTGGDGGFSSNSSGGSHSWSRGGTVVDQQVRDAAFGANSRFLEDGGLSQMDLAALRSRALSPVRSAYSDATREINRTSALQGGYSPNRVAALSRMSRERGQGIADAATNAEAGIVGLRQQGQLAGLQGMNSMYANMPVFNESESNSWNNSSSGGGGGSGSGLPVQQPNSGGGWLNTLRGVGEAVLPTVLSSFQNKPYTPSAIPYEPPSLPGSFGPVTTPNTGQYTNPGGYIGTGWAGSSGIPGQLPGTPVGGW